MNFKPLKDKILVKKDLEETKNGVFIPEKLRAEMSMSGTVVAVGPGKMVKGEFKPTQLKVGDRILFSHWSAKEVTVDNEQYHIMEESNIIAKVN
jgi:chaperonin GroES